jgi:hypothetical protein
MVPIEKMVNKPNGRSVQTFHPILSNPANAFSFIPANSDSVIQILSNGESFGICEWIIHPIKEGSQSILLRVDRRLSGKKSVIDGRVEIIPVHIRETKWSFTKTELLVILPSLLTLLCWIIDLYFKRKQVKKEHGLKFDDF